MAPWFDPAWKVGTFLFSVAAMLIAYFRTRHRDVSDALAAHDRRIQSVEERLRALPDRDDMHQISLQLAEMRGQLEVMAERLSGQNEILMRVERMSTRHEHHLLRGAE